MERKNNKLENIITLILALIYGVGVIGHLINSSKNLMLSLTPFVLLISTILVFFPLKKNNNLKIYCWFGGVFILTFSLEVIGVKTGIIFGEYIYGNILGVKIFEVPVIIGINWTLVITGAVKLSERISNKFYYKIIAAGLLAVLFDYFLEPIALKLNYWNWNGEDIPFQNYAAWFIISLASAGIYSFLKLKIESDLFERYYLVQLSFFFLLNMVL